MVSAELPVLVSVTSGINEPRYPQLKGVMAARRMEIPILTARDLGLVGHEVGEAGARERVLTVGAPPPRAAGSVYRDEGDGGIRIADYLASLGVI